MQAIVSLGSNLGDRCAIIEEALKNLFNTKGVKEIKTSSLYETLPVGYADQPDFINAACLVETELSSLDFLHVLLNIEQQFKRKRLFKNGPRTLDMDLIAYGSEICETQELILPHPRMHERAFVLIPLSEIAPDFKIAKHNRTVSELLGLLDREELNKVKKYLKNE